MIELHEFLRPLDQGPEGLTALDRNLEGRVVQGGYPCSEEGKVLVWARAGI